MKTTIERVNREKEWHNKNFGSNVRSSAGKFYSIFGQISKDMKELIIKELTNTTKFLDYGCGNGDYLINIAGQINEGVGFDISESRIEHAKSSAQIKGIKNVDFLVMDAMNTTFKDNTFDIIHGGAILHHLDLKLSLKEIKRILKTDGKAYFNEPLETNPLIALYRKLTPQMRTFDEQPLRRKDVKLIKSIFPKTEINYYFCFSIFAVPFRNSKHFNKI